MPEYEWQVCQHCEEQCRPQLVVRLSSHDYQQWYEIEAQRRQWNRTEKRRFNWLLLLALFSTPAILLGPAYILVWGLGWLAPLAFLSWMICTPDVEDGLREQQQQIIAQTGYDLKSPEAKWGYDVKEQER